MDELNSLLATLSAFISGFSLFELVGFGLVGAISLLGVIDTKRGNVWRERLIKVYKLYSKGMELRSQLRTGNALYKKSEQLYDKADRKLQKDSNADRSLDSAHNIMHEAQYYRNKAVKTFADINKAIENLPPEQSKLAITHKPRLKP